eukprot:GHUV01029134.1.p1 GENE.GHUV01029134.1~~GHUV01029134.1.p1  ORF type:complete len:229 (+),score=44.50 GHUV01029134.1:522-1208(+)
MLLGSSGGLATQVAYGTADNSLGDGYPLSFASNVFTQDGFVDMHALAQGMDDSFLQQLEVNGEEAQFDDVLEDGASNREQANAAEWACAYCGVSSPSCVVKCLTTGKWFCNERMGSSGSCIIVHLVKSKCREVQLHKDSPLGEAVLECYASGNRNVFSLGFVPVAGDNTVVLLARDTPASGPAVRDLGVDMSQVSAVSSCRGWYRCVYSCHAGANLFWACCSFHLGWV